MSLPAVYERLRAILGPLGVEIGPDVLGIWLDRERDGREPIPPTALNDLMAWASMQLAERNDSAVHRT